MKDLSRKNFGILIAFGLPGFLLLWGSSFFSDRVANWLSAGSATGGPSIGGFLYATLASFALGLVLSALRWATVEKLIYFLSKLEKSEINYGKLAARDEVLTAYEAAIDNVYCYYQFYSHTFLAGLIVSAIYFATGSSGVPWWAWIALVAIEFVLFWKSWDELESFNRRASRFTAETT